MENVAFEAWLGAIQVMTAAQRRAGLAALSLAEANDDEGFVATTLSENPVAGSPIVPVLGTSCLDCDISETNAVSHSAFSISSPIALVAETVDRRVELMGCPHCGGRKLQRWGKASGLARYRCGNCRRTFNALTKTPLARLRKKELWQDHTKALMTGESLANAADRCGVATTTAFRWRHRFLSAPSLDKPRQLTGIVEADETFILESFKGRRSDLPRAARKRGGKAAAPGLSEEQIPILIARDRTSATFDAVLPKLNKASVIAVLTGVVTPANQLCCDGGKSIVGFARKAQIPCHILPAPGGPRPEAPTFHINNVNAYHSRLKEWLRPFHGVATKYLDHYLGWRRTVEALGAKAQPQTWLQSAVGIGAYQQLTL